MVSTRGHLIDIKDTVLWSTKNIRDMILDFQDFTNFTQTNGMENTQTVWIGFQHKTDKCDFFPSLVCSLFGNNERLLSWQVKIRHFTFPFHFFELNVRNHSFIAIHFPSGGAHIMLTIYSK